MSSRNQSGLGDRDDWGDVDPHLWRRRARLAVQFYGAIVAYHRQKLPSQFDPSLATCEQLWDPSAVPDFSDGGLSGGTPGEPGESPNSTETDGANKEISENSTNVAKTGATIEGFSDTPGPDRPPTVAGSGSEGTLGETEQTSIDAVERGRLGDPGDGDLLGLVYRLGVEDNERAVGIAQEAKHSADAREALYGALEREDAERREKVLRLIETGVVGEARRLALCGRQSVQLECPDEFWAGGCGHEENYIPISCGSRLCPDCMDSQIGQKVERYGRVVSEWADPTFYTLTIENVSDAERGTDAVVGAFRRLRDRHIAPDGDGWHWYSENGEDPATGWKAQLLRAGKHDFARSLQQRYVEQGKQIPVSELLKGGIYGIDVKQKGPDEWNVHLHVLADAHWIPQQALSATWADLTGAPVVDIRRIYGRAGEDVEGALLDTVGYACSAPEFESIEDAVAYMTAMKNRRFVQSFGTTHGSVPDLEGQLLCARCENNPVRWNYLGIANKPMDTMGRTHSADSDSPPPESQ